MTRTGTTYGGSDYYRMQTPYGDLIAWSFGRDDEAGLTSVGFRTEHEHNRYDHQAPHGGWDGVAHDVTLHRVTYTAHDMARVDDAGHVASFSDASPLMRSDAPVGKTWPSSWSPAVTKWRETMTPVVEAFLASETGQTMLAQGHREANARAVTEAVERVDKARAELAEAEAALAKAQGTRV